MTAAEREALADEARAAIARRSLGAFIERVEPGYDRHARHTKLICEHLEALERREIENLAIFMPPQHGKSMHATESFPAFYIGRAEMLGERRNVALTAYGARKAEDFSTRNREKLRSPRNPFATRIDPEQDARALWKTTGGSQVVAAGVGGPLTGFGAHLLVIDDPVKDAVEAASPVDREAKWEWYLRVARTRLRRGAQQIFAQTRWHEDDLAARVLNSAAAKRWTVLLLPARCVDPAIDPLGRALGEILWPQGPEIPTPGDGTTTTKVYESMYQQNPTPDNGTVFRREWFTRFYRELPKLKSAAIFLDGAWKDGVGNDRSAFAVWGTDGIDYYLIDAWADRVEYPDLKTKAQTFWNRWRAIAPVLSPCVEDAASGIPLLQEFRRTTNIPLIGVVVDKSKVVRAEAVAGIFEGRKAVLPDPSFDHGRDTSWVDPWIEEHVGFPSRKHDDWVDTTSGALARLARPRMMAPRLV